MAHSHQLPITQSEPAGHITDLRQQVEELTAENAKLRAELEQLQKPEVERWYKDIDGHRIRRYNAHGAKYWASFNRNGFSSECPEDDARNVPITATEARAIAEREGFVIE